MKNWFSPLIFNCKSSTCKNPQISKHLRYIQHAPLASSRATPITNAYKCHFVKRLAAEFWGILWNALHETHILQSDKVSSQYTLDFDFFNRGEVRDFQVFHGALKPSWNQIDGTEIVSTTYLLAEGNYFQPPTVMRIFGFFCQFHLKNDRQIWLLCLATLSPATQTIEVKTQTPTVHHSPVQEFHHPVHTGPLNSATRGIVQGNLSSSMHGDIFHLGGFNNGRITNHHRS